MRITLKRKRLMSGLFIASSLFAINSGINAQELKLHYSLSDITSEDVIDVSGNGYNAQLKGGAKFTNFENLNAIDLGDSNGYVDMGRKCGELISTLSDFTLHSKLYIPNSTTITGNGNFIWTFSNAENIINNPDGYIFFSAKDSRYTITKTNYDAESSVSRKSAFLKGSWVNLTYTQKDKLGKIFINGELVKSGYVNLNPNDLGATDFNWLGRSCYNGDNYLKNAKIADFRIYDGELSETQVEELSGIIADKVTLKYNIDFNSLYDNIAGIKAELVNNAQIEEEAGLNILSLGDTDGYLDMGAGLGDIIASLDSFSISTNLYVPEYSELGRNGNFIYCFANSTNSASDKNGYLFMGANSTKYCITKTYYNNEQSVGANSQFEKGIWKNVTFTQSKGVAKIYVNGELKSTSSISLNPSEIGNTKYNFLGRPCYSGDIYLKGAKYNDFRIYDGALTSDSIKGLCVNLKKLNIEVYKNEILQTIKKIEIPSVLRNNITLPESFEGIDIVWNSSDQSLLTDKGVVLRPSSIQKDKVITLTGTFLKDGITVISEYNITIPSMLTDEQAVIFDLENIILDKTENITSLLKLPVDTQEGSIIRWKSNNPELISDNGRVIRLAKKEDSNNIAELTATVIKGDAKAYKTFNVSIAYDEEYSCYLFAYFTGNSPYQEQIRFALSPDGYNYTPLNEGNPVISSDSIAFKGCVRDPHILRGEDGCFYMVVTDMMSNQGWSSNDGLVLLKSSNLVDWTHKAIDFPDTWPKRFDRDNLTQVWAPQTIFDPQEGKYMVYYSIGERGKHYIIYYSYANEDFTELTEPQILYDHGSNTIDADIVYKDGLYHMFYKTEGQGNGIQKSTAETLRGEWTPYRKYYQQTSVAVEGSGVFKLINSDEWVLMYDCYGSGYYQFCRSTDLENFDWVCNTVTSGNFTPRHGTTLPVTKDEAERLFAKWPSNGISATPIGSNANEVRHFSKNIQNQTISLSVYSGTDLSSLDPKLFSFCDLSDITPKGVQNFDNGPIEYSFKLGNTSYKYRVSAEIAANPIIPDFYAEPEILYSEKTGKFYIYPATDGCSVSERNAFDVFSSSDLVNWQKENTILDLSANQVNWASGNAQAPAIIEKFVDGAYKYFFYYSGNAGSSIQIGVAVSDSPTGPFYDFGKPIITSSPADFGQQTGVHVFNDSKTDKYYIYWGKSYLAGAELNPDMVSIKELTIKIMTPDSGNNNDYAYSEAPYIFNRDNKYYFMWSVDNPGSADYHVAYGISDSPLGNISVASNPVVLIQDPANEIYGTGNNSILKAPGKADEWYIVYNRINKNYLNDSPEIHREICIDKMEFDNQGNIIPITVTNKGIEPFSLDHIFETAIDEVVIDNNKDKEIASVQFYDLNGVFISTSEHSLEKGAYIKTIVYTDGTNISYIKIK